MREEQKKYPPRFQVEVNGSDIENQTVRFAFSGADRELRFDHFLQHSGLLQNLKTGGIVASISLFVKSIAGRVTLNLFYWIVVNVHDTFILLCREDQIQEQCL